MGVVLSLTVGKGWGIEMKVQGWVIRNGWGHRRKDLGCLLLLSGWLILCLGCLLLLSGELNLNDVGIQHLPP